MKTALIVDPELGFGFWLARGLDQAGYQSYPSKSVAAAFALLDELRIAVDLLVLNPALPEAGEFIESLRRSNEHLKVVALMGDQARFPALTARVDLCCRKPRQGDDLKRREWIAHVEELLPTSLFGAAFDSSELLRKCAGALARHTQTTATPVAPSWKEWEGRVIDGQFRLQRHIGGGPHSAVFLTQYGAGTQAAAAIKIVLAHSDGRDSVLPRWERAAALSHPGLVRLLGMGTCDAAGAGLHYLLMEYAEENLADVLRQRPLTAEETREMLEPVLDALAYVHDRGLVHGRVKPSNILAIADHLKISSDWLFSIGEPATEASHPGTYDPPETAAGFISPAADVWSLGITMVEALTQRPMAPKQLQHNPPTLPVTLPPLFLEIAHQCLQSDPGQRTTIADLSSRLREAPLEMMAAPAIPWLPMGRWLYVVPVVALAMAFSGMLLRPHPVSQPPAPPPAPVRPVVAAPVPAGPRRVTQQSLPDVSKEARQTIEGTIEVRVRVRVASWGGVADAKLDSPGPSRYFANRALEAARYWKFDPLAGQAKPVDEDWMLRFDYTVDRTEASAERLSR